MTERRLSAQDHNQKVQMLRQSVVDRTDPGQKALTRAVIECVRNPVVVRAVATGLRFHYLEKP